MRTIQIKVSETDFQKYNFGSGEVKFTDLVEMISRDYARKALLACNEIAEQVGLSKMTMDEINVEIKAVRLAAVSSADYLTTGNTLDFTITEFEYTKILTPREYWDNYAPRE